MYLRVLVEVFGCPVLDVRLGGRFAECELREDATARAGHHVTSVTTGLELRTCSEILRLKERKHCVLMLKSSIENRGSTDIKTISAAGSGQEETERKWVKPQNIENNNSSRTAEIPPSGSYTIIQFHVIQALSSRGLSNIRNTSCKVKHATKQHKKTHYILITWAFVKFLKGKTTNINIYILHNAVYF